jgi:hypothetical protein
MSARRSRATGRINRLIPSKTSSRNDPEFLVGRKGVVGTPISHLPPAPACLNAWWSYVVHLMLPQNCLCTPDIWELDVQPVCGPRAIRKSPPRPPAARRVGPKPLTKR